LNASATDPGHAQASKARLPVRRLARAL